MSKIYNRLAALLSISSIITICMTFCFAFMVLKGAMSVEQFLDLYKIVLIFYFGRAVQASAAKKE